MNKGKPTPDKWAEKYFYQSPKFTARPGIIKLDPYQRDALLWFATEEKSTHCWGSGLGKLTLIKILVGWITDVSPAPTLVMFPYFEKAKRIAKKHFMEMFRENEVLSRHTIGSHIDHNKLFEYVLDNMTMSVNGAENLSSLCSIPYCYLLRYQTGMFPLFGGSLNVSSEKTASFGKKARIFDIGDPTIEDSEPWRSFKSGCQYLFFAPCPHCGEFDHLEFENFYYPARQRKEGQEKYLKRVEQETVYCCPFCYGPVTDQQKIKMLYSGEWRKTNPGAKNCSSRLPSWYARHVSFGQVAARYLDAKGNQIKMRSFKNFDCALPCEANITGIYGEKGGEEH